MAGVILIFAPAATAAATKSGKRVRSVDRAAPGRGRRGWGNGRVHGIGDAAKPLAKTARTMNSSIAPESSAVVDSARVGGGFLSADGG